MSLHLTGTHLSYVRLEAPTEGLSLISPEFLRYLTNQSEESGQTIANFLLAMKFETDLSDKYRSEHFS